MSVPTPCPSDSSGSVPRRARYDRSQLYRVVRAVAEASGRARPELIRQWQWNAARAASPYPDAPSAREVCRQLRDNNGRPFPWRRLLTAVFQEQPRTLDRIDAERRAADDGELSDEAVFYALNRVALELGRRSLSGDDYIRGRELLLQQDRRRRRRGGLEPLLPTFHQIEAAAGSWRKACALAGLDLSLSGAQARAAAPRALSIIEAAIRFYRATGLLPTYPQLCRFARDHRFSVANQQPGLGWHEQLERVRTRARELGLAEPPPYRPRIDKPAWQRPASEAPADGDPAWRPKLRWHLVDLVAAVDRYLADPQTQQPPSASSYRRWTSWNDDRPSLSAFARHGGFKNVLALARDPAARAAALARRELTADEQARRRRETLEQRAQHPSAHAILRALAAAPAPLTARAIAAAADLNHSTIHNWLPILRELGLVELASLSATARNASYCLPGRRPQRDAAELARLERQAAREGPQTVYRLLAEHGELTTNELAALIGRHRQVIVGWLRPLRQLGRISETTTASASGGRRVSYRIAADRFQVIA